MVYFVFPKRLFLHSKCRRRRPWYQKQDIVITTQRSSSSLIPPLSLLDTLPEKKK